jgi:topoisomerase-4 subunit B
MFACMSINRSAWKTTAAAFLGAHPEEKIPTVELVYTRLHAGGKFDKRGGQGAYAFSGGLHGVGVSVTNALSRRLEVEVKRDGKLHRIVFAGGDVEQKLKVIGTAAAKAGGTSVRAYPDPKYFDSPHVSLAELERLLRAKAVLLPVLRSRSISRRARRSGRRRGPTPTA